jgi:hypothetical protein
MSTTITQTTVATEEPIKTPANSGARTFFAVVGLGVGWVSATHRSNTKEAAAALR